MDVLVNFSDLVNKDRKDLASWKAACDAVNNMMSIYPECFSSMSDSFAPLRVHATLGDIDGVSQNNLESFLGRFLLVLDNEVHVESVNFQGTEQFIHAGEQVAYYMDINGGVRHHDLKDNMDLALLENFKSNIKYPFSREELRLMYHGNRLDKFPYQCFPKDSLKRELITEFTVGGDRFDRFDISLVLESLTNNQKNELIEDLRGGVEPFISNEIGDKDFYENQIKVWVIENSIEEHLGTVFEQYREPKQSLEHNQAGEVYKQLCRSSKEHGNNLKLC